MIDILDNIMDIEAYFSTMAGILTTYLFKFNELGYVLFIFMYITYIIITRKIEERENI